MTGTVSPGAFKLEGDRPCKDADGAVATMQPLDGEPTLEVIDGWSVDPATKLSSGESSEMTMSPASTSFTNPTSPTSSAHEDAPLPFPKISTSPAPWVSCFEPLLLERAVCDSPRRSSTSESLVLQQQLMPRASASSTPPPPAHLVGSRRSSTCSVSSTSSTRRRPPHHVFESPSAMFSESVNGQKTLNQYTIKHVIGKGAFGTVSLAVDSDGVEWAIKEFSKSRLRKKDHSNHFRGVRGRGRGSNAYNRNGSVPSSEDSNDPWYLVREEIAIMKKLNHPNVVTLHEVLDDPSQDSLWMVFEMCHNGVSMHIDLDQEAIAFTEEEARRCFRQLILGIEYLHANDICHRDIKPDNLLLTKDNELVIVDFGISQMFTGATDCMKMPGGSPAFMAPEMCTPAASGTVSCRAADLWAMGVVLYCFCFGHLPFRGRTTFDMFNLIINEELQIPPHVSPDLRDLLMKLLEKDPVKRIKMDQLRDHPWVTTKGADPLPCVKENTERIVEQVTEEDIKHAVRNINNIFLVLKAVSKLRKSGSFTKSESHGTGCQVASSKPADRDYLLLAPLDTAGSFAQLVLSDSPLTNEPEVSSVLGSVDSYPDHSGRSHPSTPKLPGSSSRTPLSRSATLNTSAALTNEVPEEQKPQGTTAGAVLPTSQIQQTQSPPDDGDEEQQCVYCSSP